MLVAVAPSAPGQENGMRREHYALNVSATDGAGTAFKVEDYIHQTVILRPGLVGTFVQCTLQLQVSNSDDAAGSFVNYGTAVTTGADTPLTLELEAWMYLRVVTSAAVAGAAPSCTWSGDNTRCE
jgi:hypothetical protein